MGIIWEAAQSHPLVGGERSPRAARVVRSKPERHFPWRIGAREVEACRVLPVGVAPYQFFKSNGVRFDEQRTPATRHKGKRVRPIEPIIGAYVHKHTWTIRAGQFPHESEFALHSGIAEERIFDQTAQIHSCAWSELWD